MDHTQIGEMANESFGQVALAIKEVRDLVSEMTEEVESRQPRHAK
jgi:hypothetical protein